MSFRNMSLRKKLVLLNLAVAIPILLLFFVVVFPLYKAQVISAKKELTRAAVEVAVGVLSSYEEKVAKGVLSEELAKQAALAELKGLRYNGSEYYWVHDLNNKMIMHPIKAELENTDISQTKDPDGKAFSAT